MSRALTDVFDLEPKTEILRDDPYLAAYPDLMHFFSTKDSFERGDVVCGAHIVYGWMPTVLVLDPDESRLSLEGAARLLTEAKGGASLGPIKIRELSDLVNNSVVGASKLLHFVAPQRFAIWDANIYRFIHQKPAYQYRVNDVDAYLDYLAQLGGLQEDARFGNFYEAVKRKVGYSVSELRALELIMFLNAPPATSGSGIA